MPGIRDEFPSTLIAVTFHPVLLQQAIKTPWTCADAASSAVLIANDLLLREAWWRRWAAEKRFHAEKALATAGVMRPTQRGLGELLKCRPRPVKALDSDYRARVILSYCYCTLGKRLESHIIRYFVPIPATCEHTLNRHRFTRGVKSVPVAPNSDGRSQKTPSLCYLRTELALAHTVKAQWKSESLHFRASPHHVV